MRGTHQNKPYACWRDLNWTVIVFRGSKTLPLQSKGKFVCLCAAQLERTWASCFDHVVGYCALCARSWIWDAETRASAASASVGSGQVLNVEYREYIQRAQPHREHGQALGSRLLLLGSWRRRAEHTYEVFIGNKMF